MEKLDEQELKGFGEYEDDVFRYKLYSDKIEIENTDIYNFYCLITIYKNGTFDFKTIGGDFDINEKKLDLSKLGKKYHYDYFSIKNFMDTNKSEKAKFLYLYKIFDGMYKLAWKAYLKHG